MGGNIINNFDLLVPPCFIIIVAIDTNLCILVCTWNEIFKFDTLVINFVWFV